MFDEQIRQLKLKIKKIELATAQAQLAIILQSNRPSLNLPVTIRREGPNWICMFESSEDQLECPIAYGDCPAQAMLNFDLLWYGTGQELSDIEGDEEYL